MPRRSVAEKYISELGNMAKQSNLMIVPDKPNDIGGVLATALGLGAQVSKGITK